MKVYEIKKGEADIPRGKVMMAIEGNENKVMELVRSLKNLSYDFSDCAEEADNGIDLVVFFIIDRLEVKQFRADYKANK